MPDVRHSLGDATGARSGPLAKWAVYYTAHLAIFTILLSLASMSSGRVVGDFCYNGSE